MTDHITSPNLNTDSGIVRTQKQFSDALTMDMTDEEINVAMKIVIEVKNKWQNRFRYKFNDPTTFKLDDALKLIEQFEDEIKTRLAEVEVLATVDTVPILEGQPLVIEWIGKMPYSASAMGHFDHEKKNYEVRKAKEREEDFYGQKS